MQLLIAEVKRNVYIIMTGLVTMKKPFASWQTGALMRVRENNGMGISSGLFFLTTTKSFMRHMTQHPFSLPLLF
jgi:hypothetical protein